MVIVDYFLTRVHLSSHVALLALTAVIEGARRARNAPKIGRRVEGDVGR